MESYVLVVTKWSRDFDINASFVPTMIFVKGNFGQIFRETKAGQNHCFFTIFFFRWISRCEAKGTHPAHDMLRIASPSRNYPPHFFSRLQRCDDLYFQIRNPFSNPFFLVPILGCTKSFIILKIHTPFHPWYQPRPNHCLNPWPRIY